MAAARLNLPSVFVYGGWDGTLYVNEEVKHRRTNPGRAAIMAVAIAITHYLATRESIALPLLSSVRVDVPALAFTALLAIGSALLFGQCAQYAQHSFAEPHFVAHESRRLTASFQYPAACPSLRLSLAPR